jgi:hypothetical protein
MIDYTKFEGHTAGPWPLRNEPFRNGMPYWTIEAGQGHSRKGFHLTIMCSDANAHLMAAAPDLLAENIRLRDALETLARLGNGDKYGNSDGNIIAREALEGTKP